MTFYCAYDFVGRCYAKFIKCMFTELYKYNLSFTIGQNTPNLESKYPSKWFRSAKRNLYFQELTFSINSIFIFSLFSYIKNNFEPSRKAKSRKMAARFKKKNKL